MSTIDTETRVLVRGDAWIAENTESEGYWAEGVRANIEVENTDDDELAVHISLDKGASADASFYMTYHEASRLMAALGRAVLR